MVVNLVCRLTLNIHPDHRIELQKQIGKSKKSLRAQPYLRIASVCSELPAGTVCLDLSDTRVMQHEHRNWQCRYLGQKHYVHSWADGVYSNIHLDDWLCVPVIIGATESVHKKLVAVEGYHGESETSCRELLTDFQKRRLAHTPKLTVGEGTLVFPTHRARSFQALSTSSVGPTRLPTCEAGCLNRYSKGEVVYRAERRFTIPCGGSSASTQKPRLTCAQDQNLLQAFNDFPASQWIHPRTANSIDSTLATVQLRTKRNRSSGNTGATLSMVFKLLQSAPKQSKRIKGFNPLKLIVNNLQFRIAYRWMINFTGTLPERLDTRFDHNF